MITIKEIAWVAGIIEGEGCISFNGTPSISIGMTDKDVIEEVARLFKKPVYLRYRQRQNWNHQYAVVISGTLAIQWMLTTYSFLKSRRRAKIIEVIELWKPQKSLRIRDSKTFPCGHPRELTNIYLKGTDKRCKRCYILKYQEGNRKRRLQNQLYKANGK